MPANLESSAGVTGLQKVSFHSSLKEGQYQRLFKLLYSCIHSKVGYEILQGGLRQDVNQELPDVQAGFRRGRGTRDQIANIC